MGSRRLQDRVALVTGASSGIGWATAHALAREGARLALVARRAAALEACATAIRARGGAALVLPADVTQPDEVARAVDATLARWGRVDILVTSAGAYIRSPIATMTAATVERSLAVNFYGTLYPVLAVLPHMRAQRRGHLVLVSSMDGKKGLPRDAPYVVAKFAVAGFGDVLRQELHGSGVYATTVFPGRVDTPLIATLRVPWISPKIPATAVARAIIRAIDRRQAEVILPFPARALLYAHTLSPRLADWATRLLHLEGWETPAPGATTQGDLVK
ncbi:MAG TPA: SDR family NAD(P)-dependent oxidoreductase [Chloroflexia bacterium]|nr:SDR family NAD(P)-dependent oxidoreductase [Chloroflexia bacterium]